MKKSPQIIIIAIIMSIGIIGIGLWQMKGGSGSDKTAAPEQQEAAGDSAKDTDSAKDADSAKKNDTTDKEDGLKSESDSSLKNGTDTSKEMPAYEYSQNIDEEGTLTIPEEVTEIADATYADDTRITSVVIPETVTTIGDNAFSGTSITSVTIPESVSVIGDNAFSNTALTSVEIPASAKEVASTAFADNTELKEITVSPDNTDYSSEEGVLYTDDGKTLVTVPAATESVTVPAEVTKIEDGAISGNTTTIYGYIDTAAEDYAVANDLIFISIQ